MKNLDILELGSGQGLSSLAGALSGGDVVTTDVVEDAVKLVEMSARLNGIEARMKFEQLSWNKSEDIPNSKFDVVLGSDILFFNGAVSPVVSAINKTLKPGGVAIIVDPFRLNVDGFLDKLQEAQLTYETFLFDENTIKSTHSDIQAIVKVKKGKLVIVRKPVGCGESLPRVDRFYTDLKTIVPAFTN